MLYRLALAVVMLCAGVATADAQVSTATIYYQSGSGSHGYDSASFRANYALHHCGGKLYITTEFVKGSYRWSDTYWFDGKSYPTPRGLTPTVRDQGTFNGDVRVRGGGSIGTFRSTAGLNAHGCGGLLSRVADLSTYVDVKDAAAMDNFIARLEVVPDTNPAYLNVDIENAIRHQIAGEKKKGEDEKKAEEKRQADAAAKAEEERKRQADTEIQRLREEQRKLEDEKRAKDRANGQTDGDKKAQEEADKKATAEEEQKAQEESERIARENEATKAKIDAEASARADEDAAKEAKRRADDDAARAKTEWTAVDDPDGPYWPEERCYWVDSKGFVHPPTGRHHCDPVFIHGILEAEKRQFEMELRRIEAEAKAERDQRNVEAYVGTSKEGAEMLVVAGAVAPLVDAANGAMKSMIDGHPQSVDLETIGRVVPSTGTGYGISVRYGGVVYFHAGYVSYDRGTWDRVRGGTIGIGLQAPISRRFSVRMIEAGATVGTIQHVVDETDYTGGANFRSGVLVRLFKGLSFTATLGVDSTGGWKPFVDLGAAWRFDVGNNRNYEYP